MDKDHFQFKHFKLRNRDSALKINTDGVLLAAWAELNDTDSILDIGTGGGVIAFILKHRFPSSDVLGIDIDQGSIEEAEHNLYLNPLERLSFKRQSLQEFSLKTAQRFDHIISNPPFFDVGPIQGKNLERGRKHTAKHTEQLSLNELMTCSYKLLTDGGKLSLIMPYETLSEIKKTDIGFIISKLTKVRGKEYGPYKRVLVELTKGKSAHLVKVEEFYIRGKNPLTFSARYMEITKDLYLGF